VPNFQRWVNDKKFDGGQSTDAEKELRDFYKRLLNFTIKSEALMGEYREIHFYNKEHTENYNHRVLSYVRWGKNQKLVVVSNFDNHETYTFQLKIPQEIIGEWKLKSGTYNLVDGLYGSSQNLNVENGTGTIDIHLNPLESYIFELKN